MTSEHAIDFNIRFDVEGLEERGCYHGLADSTFFAEGCRPCSINQQVEESGLRVAWTEEFYYRTFSGRAETPAQRIALARLIAIVQGHPEPLELLGSEKALAKLT